MSSMSDQNNNNTLSTEDTQNLDNGNVCVVYEDNEVEEFDDSPLENPIADKDSIKNLFDALYSDDADTCLANWNDPQKVTDDMVSALKSAVGTNRIRLNTNTNFFSKSKYTVIFTGPKRPYPGGSDNAEADFIVTYNVNTDTAYYTESWAWC